MHSIIDTAKETGVTAIIASGMADILYAASVGQDVQFSTQVDISNTVAVRFYTRWADVMVLARELSLPQVSAIHKAIMEEGITGPG